MTPTAGIELWAGAIWIGQVDEWELLSASVIELAGGTAYSQARLLVSRLNGSFAFVEAQVANGMIRSKELLAYLPDSDPVLPLSIPEVSVTLIICTKNRPDMLREVLTSLSALDYRNYDVLVVDNDPSSGLTPPIVGAFAGVGIVDAPEPGLSKARNVGLLTATNEFVAFTDDDVVIDKNWLRELVGGFAVADDVHLVTGLVPTGEVSTPAQAFFDRRVSWSKNLKRTTYRLSDPPEHDALFPFRVGDFGTGANFAVRRSKMLELGGFDEGLGVGSPSGGGEDIDMFVRVILDGGALVYAPAARVWHRHRIDPAGLNKQMADYGLGLGAWLTKLAMDPRIAIMLGTRVVKGLSHFGSVSQPEEGQVRLPSDLDKLPWIERRALLWGPAALLRSRMGGLRGRPLLPRGTRPARRQVAVEFPGARPIRRAIATVDARWPTGEHRLAVLGLVGGVCGLIGAGLGAIGTLTGIAVAIFVAIGPGAAIMSYMPDQPGYVRVAAVPALGISTVVLMTFLMTTVEEYYPFSQLVIPSIATVGASLVRLFTLEHRPDGFGRGNVVRRIGSVLSGFRRS
ncbi:glycosyltransferase family 2 protein [Rhodococcus sp. NPDC060176]|uniref:glycosyltransferase family 2 protein n=1 Tax=unclassified Rhodococcus (in: high G+C Gram-positive bacteria) TaxID=192944 RepID=UPI003648E5D1